MPKNGQFWRLLEYLKLPVKQCYQTGHFKTVKKVVENARNRQIWRLFQNLTLVVKQCYQICHIESKTKNDQKCQNRQNTQFGEFQKTISLHSKSVTRQVNFNRTKIDEKFKCDIFESFSTNVMFTTLPVFCLFFSRIVIKCRCFLAFCESD